jgi:hypothetical protein
MFTQMTASMPEEVAKRLATAEPGDLTGRSRGATWTYLTTDEPFGSVTQRILRAVVSRWRHRS